MKRGERWIVLAFAAVVVPAASFAVAAFYLPLTAGDVIYETESPYQSIFITESRGIRRMHVGSLTDRTSAMDLQKPYRHVYEYTALMMVALGYVEAPEKVLVVGLGGGTLTRTLRLLLPDAEIVNVEFDPEIVAMARRFFSYAEDDRMRLVVQDVRRWMRDSDERFDLIFLDAYHGGYIPFHLTTREFLTIVKAHLTPSGVVCANTWTSQRLADRESATYHEVFDDFHHYLGYRSSNRIIVASPESLPGPETIRQRLAEIQNRRAPEHMELESLFERHFDSDPTWAGNAAVLTDDHAPVNLLKDWR